MNKKKNIPHRTARPLSIVNYPLSIIAAALLLFAACTNDADPEPQPRLKTVTATLPQTTGTRVNIEYDQPGNAMKVSWAEGDVIKVGNITSQPLTADDIDTNTGAATFTFASEPDFTQAITYGTHATTQTQTADNDYAHLPGSHTMIGTYNADANAITFAHNVSVLRIALSGLKTSAVVTTLTVGGYTLSLNGCTTTAQGTFTGWLSMEAGTGIENLEFKIVYGVDDEQTYIHPFPEGETLLSGKLLHCNINMGTKVGFVIDAETFWEVPLHVVPPGYDYVVYDEASFLAMPVESGKRIIQVVDIELTSGLSNKFEGIYNGNGYTITGSSKYAFTKIENAIITYVHVRGGIKLADVSISSGIFHCSAVGNVLARESDGGVFTLCSTDQEKLVDVRDHTGFYACWYNGAPRDVEAYYNVDVWDETTKSMVDVPFADLLNEDGSINWNYKYPASTR